MALVDVSINDVDTKSRRFSRLGETRFQSNQFCIQIQWNIKKNIYTYIREWIKMYTKCQASCKKNGISLLFHWKLIASSLIDTYRMTLKFQSTVVLFVFFFSYSSNMQTHTHIFIPSHSSLFLVNLFS